MCNTLQIPVEQADDHTQAEWPGLNEWHGPGKEGETAQGVEEGY